MAFDYSTLITDRAQTDIDALKALVKKPMSQWTAEEAEAFRAATLKGSYDYTDLNRVNACMEDLVSRLNWLGCNVPGYERVVIDRTSTPTSRLPAGYTEVAYIQSSGTQYVDTGIVPNANTRVCMDFKLNETGTGNRCLFGVDGQFSFRWYGPNSVFRTNGSNIVEFQTGIAGTARHTVDKTATSTSIDGTYTATTTAGTVTLSLFLSAQHKNDGSAYNYASADIYSCQIYDNGTLVRDFVPCINTDNAVGLYDLVNGQFYGNAGTGTFTAGDAVVTASESDTDALDPYTWYVTDNPTRTQMEQYRQNVAAVRAVLALPEGTASGPETMRPLKPAGANAIEAVLAVMDEILNNIPAARRHCGVSVCGSKGVIM